MVLLCYEVGSKGSRESRSKNEMIAIKDLRDRLVDKHISEHAQASINKLYREINE